MKLDSIGKNIRKYRQKKGFLQEDLAEKTGLSTNYIGMLERGEKMPALDTFISILNALEVSADMVLMDVLKVGYTIKNSMLNDRIGKISLKDKERLYEVIEIILKYSEEIAKKYGVTAKEVESQISEAIKIGMANH